MSGTRAAQTGLKEPRLWELACSENGGGSGAFTSNQPTRLPVPPFLPATGHRPISKGRSRLPPPPVAPSSPRGEIRIRGSAFLNNTAATPRAPLILLHIRDWKGGRLANVTRRNWFPVNFMRGFAHGPMPRSVNSVSERGRGDLIRNSSLPLMRGSFREH